MPIFQAMKKAFSNKFLIFYPVANIITNKASKKILIVLSFFLMSFVYFFIYFLGRKPISNLFQAYLFIVLYSIPLSFLSIQPNAVLADIAEYNALKTGIRQERMFFLYSYLTFHEIN